jgi:hypothetical protein
MLQKPVEKRKDSAEREIVQIEAHDKRRMRRTGSVN